MRSLGGLVLLSGIGVALFVYLPAPVDRHLPEVGWSKATELVKIARSEGERFQSEPWLQRARTLPKQQFKVEVEKYLTGKSSEPSELMYFKIYRSQMPVIEQALETAARMLGSDKSRGYSLEMICADFLAGAHLQDDGSSKSLYLAFCRLFQMLPDELRERFRRQLQKVA